MVIWNMPTETVSGSIRFLHASVLLDPEPIEKSKPLSVYSKS